MKIVKTKDGKEIEEHLLCSYCGCDSRDKKITLRIRMNGKSVSIGFCCKDAGGIYQMGCN